MAAFFRSVYQAFLNGTSPPKKTEPTFEPERTAFKADLLKVLDVNSNIRQQRALFQAIDQAIQGGNLQAFHRIITENPQLVHARNEQGQTPLHYATFWKDFEIAELLLQQGADVNAKDSKQKAPRDYYAEEKLKTNPEIAKLVYWGPLYRDEEQLFRAILRINYQKLGVDRLMRSNDKLFDGFGHAIYNIITVSVSKIGEEEAINAFRISAQILQLEERLRPRTVEDIEKEIKNELLYLYEDLYICFTGTKNYPSLRSALCEAFSYAPYITKKFTSTRDSSSIELWQKHVKENFPPNGEQKTAEEIREITNRNRIAAAVAAISMEQREKFFWAINRGDLRSVTKYLQRNSLLAHIKNDKNQTPLHYAMDQENPDIVKFLVKEGANINAQDFLGRTPLHYVIKGNDLEKAKLLIAHGAVINVKDNDGQTPLHYALEANPKMAKILVDYCAIKSVPNKKGRDSASIRIILTLRHATVFYDIQKNNFQRFERFIQKNPYLVFIRNKEGQTPLHIAIKLNRLDMVKLLIEKGAAINVKDRKSQTPLHIAIKLNRLDMVKLLIEEGAEVNGKTPLDFAVDEKGIELLAKKGATEVPAQNPQKEDKGKEEEKEEIAVAVEHPEAIKFTAGEPSVAPQPNSPLLHRRLSAPNSIGNKKDCNSDPSLSELEEKLEKSKKRVDSLKAPSSPPPFRPIDIDLPDRLYKLYAFFCSSIEPKQKSASQCQSEVDKVIHARTDSSILGQ